MDWAFPRSMSLTFDLVNDGNSKLHICSTSIVLTGSWKGGDTCLVW